jgi:hypothetical protein
MSRAGCASLVALGVLGFSIAPAAADGMTATITGVMPTVPSSTSSSFVAPLWVYPSTPGAVPYRTAPPPPSGPSVLVIRDEPSLLRPADLHFSVDTENGVTVVRGPLAR